MLPSNFNDSNDERVICRWLHQQLALPSEVAISSKCKLKEKKEEERISRQQNDMVHGQQGNGLYCKPRLHIKGYLTKSGEPKAQLPSC